MKGWLLGSVDGATVGLLPANYVKVLGKRRGTKVSNYPVNANLDSFTDNGAGAQQSGLQGVPGLPAGVRDLPGQPGSASLGLGPSSDLGVGPTLGLHQSPSALTFEKQMQREFNSEPNMDSMLSNQTNPLDQIPELERSSPDSSDEQS